ncbi:uncharacterized protein BP01DRAFT_391043 [Aspergillus saccharolyticus JOP 1030-1]|uniref:Uncharacterized protein n=1 Tax=Aspergillus saccharolyticus JOP 1030-1 TaxID=1450539 RepID=A0A319AHU3_9EURO|nr:hypothetical protein BP01DRAFT_391043 [Aspergillus saccharolyticus JOP 1030-1]PYH46202.1 hypothetical protein BP01DRAFT_391043 [Aspergillus saccharolyticus JOP 1030-1]
MPHRLPSVLNRKLNLNLSRSLHHPISYRPISSTSISSTRNFHPSSSSSSSSSSSRTPFQSGRAATLPPNPTTRIATYTTSTSSISPSGKSTSDVIVEELQDLYETAKDEFEIATESTDNATIYAASDRASARDALNELLAVYTLYTRDVSLLDAAGRSGVEKLLGAEAGEEITIDTGLNPQGIEEEARAEVKRRVGQRVRELKGAIEALEERGNEE